MGNLSKIFFNKYFFHKKTELNRYIFSFLRKYSLSNKNSFYDMLNIFK